VDYVRSGDVKQTRFAILHVATALELVFKARLAMQDPFLIVRGNHVTEDALERGEFQSVGIEEAVERLKTAGLLSLGDHQVSHLKTLRNMRNRVTHFACAANADEARAALGAGLQLFIEIHNSGFTDDDVYPAKSMQALVEELSRCNEFVNERHRQLAETILTAARPRTRHLEECQHCLQDAIVIIGESLKCIFCGANATIHDYVERISDDNTVGVCKTCGRKSVMCHFSQGAEQPTYECICCGDFRGPAVTWTVLAAL
jgi:hypothetical protein